MPAEVQQKEIKAGLLKQKLETGHLQGPFKLWGRRPRRRRETEEGRERGDVVPSSCFRSVALKLLGLRTTLYSESGDSKELSVMWVLSMKTEPY